METIAVIFLGVLVLGYFVLAGRDIGLGMLLPIARGKGERRRAFAAMAPHFLGTEVWLVAAIGVAAGVFPEFKEALLVWAWPVLVALAAAWLCRDAGLWFWALGSGPRWRGIWDAAVVAGSWGLAAAWGLFFGGLLTGGTVLGPVALGCVAVSAALFALRGAAFGAERLVAPLDDSASAGESEAADLAARATRWLARAALAAVLVTAGLALVPGMAALDRPLPAAAVLVSLAAVLAVTTGLSGPRWSEYTSAYAMAVPVLLVAAGVNLPGLAADPATLSLVSLAVAPALPVMVIGQVWLYILLRGPVSAGQRTSSASAQGYTDARASERAESPTPLAEGPAASAAQQARSASAPEIQGYFA